MAKRIMLITMANKPRVMMRNGQREELEQRFEHRVDQSEDQGDEQDLPDVAGEIDAGNDAGGHPKGGRVDEDLDQETHGSDCRATNIVAR